MLLLTGFSGFLGQVILDELQDNHEIYTIGRSDNANIKIDLLRPFKLSKTFDCIIHAAGKAHFVPRSASEMKAFWDVNVIGTRNLLNALELSPPKRFVFISSVAVYGVSAGVSLTEQTPLLASDPYGLSKLQAEVEVTNWCLRYGVICTILRLPLIFGENPPGNLNAMIKGIKKGYYFNIAGGLACKSMVRATDVARFIIPASEIGGVYHLTDGLHPNFHALSYFLAKSMGKSWIPNMPYLLARILAKFGDLFGPKFPFNTDKLHKITTELTFDDSLAREKFKWSPNPIIG